MQIHMLWFRVWFRVKCRFEYRFKNDKTNQNKTHIRVQVSGKVQPWHKVLLWQLAQAPTLAAE